MLGKLSKDVVHQDGVLSWMSRGKAHVVLIDDHVTDDTINRLKQIKKANFHYLSQYSLERISREFSVKKDKGWSVIIDVSDVSLVGKKNRRFRNFINRHSGLRISNELIGGPKDLEVMLKRWSEVLGSKYFRNMSGKNLYFVKNGYHQECENLFIYDNDCLVSFGIASPVVDRKTSYIIGKALSDVYPGLAEFTDIVMYRKLFEKHGSFSINLGQGSGGLLSYKMKFPGARKEEHFHGSFEEFG
jgi:hypothetical protein